MVTAAVLPRSRSRRGFVVARMIPGTAAVGVLIGDLVYTWMAFGWPADPVRTDVTAMPLGLDTPSTFGWRSSSCSRPWCIA